MISVTSIVKAGGHSANRSPVWDSGIVLDGYVPLRKRG